jgi:hypothetical protein
VAKAPPIATGRLLSLRLFSTLLKTSMSEPWDPMYEGQLPWSTRLFVIYLAVVLLVFCFRAIRVLWHLRSLRKAALEANGF